MEHLYLTPNEERILHLMVIEGLELKEISKKLKIKIFTLYSYIRDIKYTNDCTLYQLIYRYAQVGIRYKIVSRKTRTDKILDHNLHNLH